MRHPLVTPVVLVAHGSRDPRSSEVTRRLARATGGTAGFLDFDRPHPSTVLAELAESGHRAVTLVPLLLTHAYHGRVDIPAVAEHARRRHPGLDIRITAPVGGPSLLPAVTRDMPDCDAMVLAAAGSSDPQALDGIDRLARDWSRRTGRACRPGYASTATPDVGAAVAELRAQGARRIAVASWFIAPGRLHDRVLAAAEAAGAVWAGPPMGACPELVTAIIDRYRTPTASRVAGANSAAIVPTPRIQAGTANHHKPAWAR